MRAFEADSVKTIRLGLVGAICAAFLLAPTASALAMRLDPTFGSKGRVAGATSQTAQEGTWIATAANGDTIVASHGILAAYLPDGRLDRSFGDGGTTPIVKEPGFELEQSDLAVDSQGRIVLFGALVTLNDPAIPLNYLGGMLNSRVAAVLRFTPGGMPDSSFGVNGIVRSDLGLPHVEHTNKPVTTGASGFVDSQDRPVFVGGRLEFPASCGHSSAQRQDKMVVRLNANGSFDMSFGEGSGIELIGNISTIPAIAPSRDGNTMVAANPPVGCESRNQATVIALDPQGLPDLTFNGRGWRGVGQIYPTDLAVDRHGRTVIVGWPGRPKSAVASVVRLNAAGKLDHDFGRNGRTRISAGGSLSTYSSVVLDSHNRPIVAGTRVQEAEARWLTAIRLTVRGNIDRRFVGSEPITVRFGAASRPTETDALVDPQGRLLLAGDNYNRRTNEVGYGLARFAERRGR